VAVTDIFFSYSSADRERVRPIRDALAAQGFEVFWDQQVPAGMDWDTWIRQHLIKSKCAMAFWSATSVSSDNVRHEAMVAKQQGKLISVLLEPLTAEQFPMGLYAQQAANLSGWSGDYDNDQWRKFRREFEAKLTPLWVRRQIDEIEAELVGERTRREGAERRDRTMQAQIAKEVEVQQAWKRERDDAVDEVAKLKATVEELNQARADAKAKQAEAQQAWTRDRNKALDKVVALKTTVEELTQSRADADARVLDLSQRLRNVREAEQQRLAAIKEEEKANAAEVEAKLNAAEAEQQRLKEEVQLQTKAAADAEAKRKAAEAEQQRLKEEVQRQANLAADSKAQKTARSISAALPPFVIAAAVATLGFWSYQLIWSVPPPVVAVTSEPTPEAEQQRLKEEVQRQAKLAADAEAKRKTAEAEQQRLAAMQAPRLGNSTGLFAVRGDTEAYIASGSDFVDRSNLPSRAECEVSCARLSRCKAFAYNKKSLACFMYAKADFRPSDAFDSGVRIEQTNPSADIKVAAPTSAATQVNSTGRFSITENAEALPTASPQEYASTVTSRAACEEICTRETSCKIFTYNKSSGLCYRYAQAIFRSNPTFDSGVRY
jgi:chemotaxis protein histidine kinase CheA